MLTRVIRARRGWIVAVVSGDDQQIALPDLIEDARKLEVEPFEIRSIPCDVVAVAILRIEIDEVREHQSVRRFTHHPDDRVHPTLVAAGRHAAPDAPPREEVSGLPD